MPAKGVDQMRTREFTATATRESKWWVVEVDGVGTTQGRSAAEARAMAKDLVAAMLDVPEDDIEVAVMFEVPGALGQEVREAQEATLEAALAQEQAAIKSRGAVARLKAEGLTGTDIAAVLDLSPQRVSQLAKQPREVDREKNRAIRDWARKRGLKVSNRSRLEPARR